MATFTYSMIGQSRPANTNPATLATLSSGTEWVGTTVKICNTTSGAVTYRLFHDNDGTTMDETTALAFDKSIAANTTEEVTNITGSTATGSIGVRTSSANALNFTAYACVKTA